MNINTMYFETLMDYGRKSVWNVLFGKDVCKESPKEWGIHKWRFHNDFLMKANTKDYYLFITTTAQEARFLEHEKDYGMDKMKVYQSPFVFPNACYTLSPKLTLRMYKFTQEFLDNFKEEKK